LGRPSPAERSPVPPGAFTALPVAALISSFIFNYVASQEVVYEPEQHKPQPRSERRKRRDADAGGDATTVQ
jgi:hypothetical protein